MKYQLIIKRIFAVIMFVIVLVVTYNTVFRKDDQSLKPFYKVMAIICYIAAITFAILQQRYRQSKQITVLKSKVHGVPDITIIRKGYFQLGNAEIQIDNDLKFTLLGRERMIIQLPEGEHSVIVRLGISTTTQTIKINYNTKAITLIPSLPGGFFAVGLFLPIFLFYNSLFLNSEKMFVAITVMAVLYLGLVGYLFARPNKLFKCIVSA